MRQHLGAPPSRKSNTTFLLAGAASMGDHLEFGAPTRGNADFRGQTLISSLDSAFIGEEEEESVGSEAIGSGRPTAARDSSGLDEIVRRLATVLSFDPPHSTTFSRIDNSDIYSSSSNGRRGSQLRHSYPTSFEYLYHPRFQNIHTSPFQSHSLHTHGLPCSSRYPISNHLNPIPIDYSQRRTIRRPTPLDLIRYNLLAVPLDLATVMVKSSCSFCRDYAPVVAEPPCHACLVVFLDLRAADITESILDAVLQMVHHVMMNSNGRSIFEKLLSVANGHQLRRIRDSVADDRAKLLRFARDTSGSQCLMKLIETVKLPIGRILRNKVVKLMSSKHGASVLNCSFRNLNYEDNLVFISGALEHCFDLAVTRTGCMSLTCCIHNSKEPERSDLLKSVVERSIDLSFDSYGNYAVNCALGLQVSWATDRICFVLSRVVEKLSIHKNGSYVIEKCLKSSGKHFIIEALARLADCKLEEMVRNEYGNYVLKTAVNCGCSNSIQSSMRHSNLLHYLQLFYKVQRLVMPYRFNPFVKKLYEVIMRTKIHQLQAD